MILGFSTHINEKETFFVEKIQSGILERLSVGIDGDYLTKSNIGMAISGQPKLHTIREYKNDRWQVGTKIDFFINVRQKDMFRFAPVLPVVNTQKVYMTYKFGDVIEISIGEKYLASYIDRLEFAINDGFDNWQDFFNYFYPKIMAAEKQFYKAKLIHWTDLRY